MLASGGDGGGLCLENLRKVNVKSFPSYKAYADLRFISPQPDTSLYCKTMDTGLMFTSPSFRCYSLRLSTQEWPG